MLTRINPPVPGKLSPSFSAFKNSVKQVLLLKRCFLFIGVLLWFQCAMAQGGNVRGRVMSGDTALPNVTVQVKGLSTATQTDISGNFSIQAAPTATLVI